MSRFKHPRRGTSYLEIQVAMVLLSIGMAGLYSMSVVQTRQTTQLNDVLPAADIAALNRAADPWARKLGVYASVETLTNPLDPIAPYSYIERVLDNADGSPTITTYKDPTDTYDWISWNNFGSYLSNAHYHRSNGNVGSYMEFQTTGLPIGEYEVMTTYRSLGSLGSSIAHQIYDGNVLRTTVSVNQKTTPTDVTFAGRQWDRLAVVQVDTGTLRIRLLDGPGCLNYILGDGMLVRSARSLDLVSVTETAGGGASAILDAP